MANTECAGSGVTGAQTLIRGGSEAEFVDQLSDTAFDVVADGADAWGVEARGVAGVIPGFVAFAGEDGASIPTTHADHDLSGAAGFVSPGLGELVGDVDAAFGHCGDCGGVDFVPGF